MNTLEMGEQTAFERELKMDVADDFALPDFGGVGAKIEDFDTNTMVAVYWDTTDLRLARANYGVRHRTDGAWTVKGPSRRTAAALLKRSEEEFPGDSAYPPSPVISRVRGAIGEAHLQPTVQLITQRRTLVVRLDGAVVEVVHDLVTVSANGVVCGDFCEVELELKSGEEVVVTKLEQLLKTAGAKPSDVPSKYIKALTLAGRWR
jgi:inorganic triphosphatase YgiF